LHIPFKNVRGRPIDWVIVGKLQVDTARVAGDQVFIARQPILDRHKQVHAYELLFRASSSAPTADTTSSTATARVITDAMIAFDLDTVTHRRPAFINVTRDLLLAGIPTTLPPKRFVIELLENIEADPEVVAACQALRNAGYQIALDDFQLTERTAGLLPIATFVKVDFILTPDAAERQRVIAAARQHGCVPIAEKVETVEQFDAAVAEGFEFFQGYFFGRPVTKGARDIPADKIAHLRLLHALSDPNLTVHTLESLVKHDASLCFRVLRTVNSAAFGQATEINSIKQALVLMGIDTVRRWVSLWVMAGLNDRAHPEVIDMASIRARSCELLALRQDGPDAASAGFLLGMCSMLDAILARPMEAVLTQLPLPKETQAALRGEDTQARRLLDCAIAYERGEWDRCLELAHRAGFDPTALPAAHRDALRWSAEFLKAS